MGGLFGGGRQDGSRSQIEQMSHEFVWVLGLDAEPVELPFGKVVELRRDDHLSSAANGRGEDMAVVRIRQRQSWDEILVAFDQAVWDRGVHQGPGSLERSRLQIWAVRQDAAEALVEDLVAPPRTYETRPGEPKEPITEGRRVEHARVVDDDEPHPDLSVAKAERFGLLGERT